MELSMKRSGIACCEKVFEYVMPVEQAAETVVPDTMPDVERILCADGIVIIRSKEVNEGRVNVSAGVAATVVYAPEGGGKPLSINAVVPVELDLDAPGVTQESVPIAMLSLTGIEARMLNPRKLLVRAVILAQVECYSQTEMNFCDGLEGEGEENVEVLTDSRTISPVVSAREKTFVVSDEYRLPPGAPALGELLWHGVDIATGSVRAVGSKIVFSGTVRMTVLYEAAETGELASASFETEFSQMIDTGADLSSPDCSIYSMLTAEYVEPVTLSGGERGISAEFHIVSQAVCTDSVRVTCVTDCYSNSRELEISSEETELGCVQRRSTVRATVHESLPATPPAAEICRVMCRTGAAVCEGGTLKCPVTVTVLYRAADGQFYSVSRRLTSEAPAELGENEYAALVRASCTDCSASPSATGADVRLLVDFELLVVKKITVPQISSVVCGEELDAGCLPSITVVRAGPGDTLWALGKCYRSTARLIAAQNGLGEGESLEGRTLLIPTARHK